MADLGDPTIDRTLEAELVRALRVEADSIPFRVRAADVRAAAARTSSRRRRLPVALAASVALLTVGAITFTITTRAPGDVGAAPAAMPDLPSYERLLEVSIGGRELARGEGVVAADATVLSVPVVTGFHPAEVVFTCNGSAVTLSAAGDGSPIRELLGGLDFDCSSGVSRTWIAGPAAIGASGTGLRIEADAGTAWRAIVIGLPDTADVVAGTEAVAGLPSFEELAAAESASSLPEVARAAAAATGESTLYRVPGLGEPAAMQSVLACTGGPLTLVWARRPDVVGG